jgi:hypothetical protein
MATTNETLLAISLWLNMVVTVLILVIVCYLVFSPSKKEMEFLEKLRQKKSEE